MDKGMRITMKRVCEYTFVVKEILENQRGILGVGGRIVLSSEFTIQSAGLGFKIEV